MRVCNRTARKEDGKRLLFEEIQKTRINLILQIGTFRLRNDPSGRPVLTNGKRPKLQSAFVYIQLLRWLHKNNLPSWYLSHFVA